MDKVVSLSRTYEAGSLKFDSVTLREPTYNDVYMSGLGEPQEWQPVPGGNAFITYPERVDAYLQRLCTAPGYEFLAPLGTIDALSLKEAVCGFFMEEKAPTPSSMPSSSVSDGAPPTSMN